MASKHAKWDLELEIFGHKDIQNYLAHLVKGGALDFDSVVEACGSGFEIKGKSDEELLNNISDMDSIYKFIDMDDYMTWCNFEVPNFKVDSLYASFKLEVVKELFEKLTLEQLEIIKSNYL